MDYDVFDEQHEFLTLPDRFTAFIGGVGSGKTHAGALKALITMLENPTWARGIVTAPTYGMLLDSTWETCLEVWEPFIAEKKTSPAPEITLITGQIALFRSAENPDRLRGPNLWWAWIDEGAYCHKNTWSRVIARLRAGGVAGPCWITTTPNQINWVADLAESGTVALIVAETLANPFTAVEYVRSLYEQYDDQLAAQELGGKFIRFGAGLIKDSMLKPVSYINVPRGLNWYRYWDLATTIKKRSDYTASVRVAFDDPSSTAWYSRPILFKAEWPDVREVIVRVMRAEAGETVGVGIESNAFQVAAAQELVRLPEARKTAIFPIHTDADKLVRALPWITQGTAGRVYAIEEPPTYDLFAVSWSVWRAQLRAFPEGEHDDAIDAMSGAWVTEGQMPRLPKARASRSRKAA